MAHVGGLLPAQFMARVRGADLARCLVVVRQSRSQQLLARLKSDARDVGAMAELMIRGGGRPPATRTDALATQAA